MGVYIDRDKLLIRIKNIYSELTVDTTPPRILFSSILQDIEDSESINADMKTAYDNGFEAGVKSTVRHYTGEMDPKEMARQFQEISDKHFGPETKDRYKVVEITGTNELDWRVKTLTTFDDLDMASSFLLTISNESPERRFTLMEAR